MFGAVILLIGLTASDIGLSWPRLRLLYLVAFFQGLTLGATVGGILALYTGRTASLSSWFTFSLLLLLIGLGPTNDWFVVPRSGRLERILLVLLAILLATPLVDLLDHWLRWPIGRADAAARMQAFRVILAFKDTRKARAILVVIPTAGGVMLLGAALGLEVGFWLGGSLGAVLGQVLGPVATLAVAAWLGWLHDPRAEEGGSLRFGLVLVSLSGVLGIAWLLFYTTTGDTSVTRPLMPAAVRCVAVSADGQSQLTVDGRGEVYLWDRVLHELTGEPRFGHPQRIAQGASLAGFGPLEQSGYLAQEQSVQLFRTDDPSNRQAWTTLAIPHALHVVPNAKRRALLVQAAGNHTLDIWRVDKLRMLSRFAIGDADALALAWSSSGATVLLGLRDGRVRLLDLEPPVRARSLPASRGPVRAALFTPDGQMALSAGSDWMIRLWHVATATPAGQLVGHRGAVNALAVSSDGTHLLSGSADRTVRLWDLQERRLLATFHGHTDAVLSVAFVPDGTAMSGGADRTVRRWKLP
jgi:hypothetical protein